MEALGRGNAGHLHRAASQRGLNRARQRAGFFHSLTSCFCQHKKQSARANSIPCNGARNSFSRRMQSCVHGNGENALGQSPSSSGLDDLQFAVQGRTAYSLSRVKSGSRNMANENISMGAGNDVITTGAGNDTIHAGDGNNRVKAGGGSNQIYTGSGNDTITAYGTARDSNYIDAGAGNDCIDLGAACDTVLIGSGNNTLHAGAGDDRGIVKFGEAVGARNFMCGGAGCDTLVLQFTQAELARSDVQADLKRFQAALASGEGCKSFQFSSMDLKVIDWERLEIQIINKDPVLAGQLKFEGTEDQALNLNLLTNATDPDGDTMKVTSVDGAKNGTAVIDADGTVTYTPNSNWSGTETITYAVDDGKGGVVKGTATITIAPVADEPTLSASFPTLETLFLNAALTDTDGSETLSVTIGLPPGVSLAPADGTLDPDTKLWTFSQAALDRGQVTFVTEGAAVVPPTLELIATVRDGDSELKKTLVVEVDNRSPSIVEQEFTGTEDEALILNLLATATDPDGDPLTLASVTVDGGMPHGTLNVNPDGTVTYTPDPNWSGTETVKYVVEDGKGGRAEGLATVTIAPVVDVPDLNLARVGLSTVFVDARPADRDGSETLSLSIELPQGLKLAPADGTQDPATGRWYFSQDVLDNPRAVTFVSEFGAEPTSELVLTAVVRESNGDELTRTYHLWHNAGTRIDFNALPEPDQIIDGAGGIDTLVFSGVAELDLTALATGALRNFEKVDIADGATTKLTLSGDVVSGMSSTQSLQVTGDANDSVTLTDEWTLVRTEGEFAVYQNDLLADVTLLVQSSLTVH
ncbi:tandem-95 repeat protein [Variovorax sp. J22R24]|uniref:Ig-like domain-containing protein n=1 Tax=Variovorax gracilis TaxID=3053502 RepID=UPI002577F3AF|nr:tandem-95 repeat protein [Variovorax sp. J22R24]MDM0105834.1 tandem-95 repeat protein [Variovorax sp. J22R24]